MGTAGLANAAQPMRPVALTTTVRVEVGAAGQVVSAIADEKLTPALVDPVLAGARALRFGLPAEASSSGVTFVQIRVCVAPVGDGAAVATQYLANGPRAVDYPPPAYPMSAAKAGRSGDFKVTLQVGADGKPTLEAIRDASGATVRSDFRQSIAEWVPRLRYEPEQLAGKPVATRVEVPLSFEVFGSQRSLAVDLERKRKESDTSDLCQRAMDEQKPAPVAVALDSPFVLRTGT